MIAILLQSDASLFVGRLHPLIVHLPIGFLILAIIFYFISYSERFNSLKHSIPYILFFGAVSGLLSVILGLLLASKGGYNENILGWHKWLAIVLVIISFGLWAWLVWGNKNKKITTGLMASVLLLITVTGHLGGTLTHGERYIYEYAPDLIRNQFLVNNGIVIEDLGQDPDSIFLYSDLIQPVLNQKCISCHNNENKSGGLNLTHLQALLEGGDNADLLIAGNALKSELFRRVTMDPNSRKFMPPNGVPLSYTETLLIQEWINNGLDTSLAISDDVLTPSVKSQFQLSYGLDTRQKSFVEKLNLTPVNDTLLMNLKNQGFAIKKLSDDMNLLDVKYSDSITVEKLRLLDSIREHIVWLDLSGTSINDALLDHLPDLDNLVRLDLHNNPIASIASLSNLENLEVLNLHTTQVSNTHIGEITKIESLKTLYLWQSEVSKDKVDSLRNSLPALDLNFGSKLIIKKDSIKRNELSL